MAFYYFKLFRGSFDVCVATSSLAQAQSRAVDVEQPGYEPKSEEEELSPEFQRQLVFFRTTKPPGTIVVNTSDRFLYLVQPNNRALRYGIGVGREGFQWFGLKTLTVSQNGRTGRRLPK